MAAFWRFASRSRAPIAAALASQTAFTCCESPLLQSPDLSSSDDDNKAPQLSREEGMRPEEEGDFHNLFPKRQLWQPKLEYPLWNKNWDGREPPSTGDVEQDRRQSRHIRKTGVTRHIILIRHGQYDETSKEDEKRILTPLGREQAHLTGMRLAEMIRGAQDNFGPCNVRVLTVSNMTRAKETARIISLYLPGVEFAEPDPLLNEGRPCHHIPGGTATAKVIEATDANHPRIEQGFQKFFYRAPLPELLEVSLDENAPEKASVSAEDEKKKKKEKHEFDIIVCHANVIRYFLCRAIQIPPEAWLRMAPFNCSLTYLTIRPIGTVSVRMLGDIGHLPYGKSTFSMHQGFNW